MRMKFRSLKLRQLNDSTSIGNSNQNVISTRSTNDDNTDTSHAHDIKALVMTCIDFRLIDDAVTFLNSKGYLNNYDEFILAGASLGYNTSLNKISSSYSGWDKVLENHIDISYSLHNIKEIIVIDHMDCGAYKKQLNNDVAFEKYDEINKHVENLNIFRNAINTKYVKDGLPKYDVKLWLMRLDGTVDINPTYWQMDSIKKIKIPKNSVIVIGNKTLPSSFTSVNTSIIEPKSTLSSFTYMLLDKDGKEITSPFINVKKEGDIWYIESTSSVSEFGTLSSLEYRVQLANSLAYIKVKMFVESGNDADVTFTFENSDYF